MALTALLVACGQSAEQARAAHAAREAGSGATVKPIPSPSDALDPDMVAAVSPGGSATPIGMKFRLLARPRVGTPLQIQVALIPAADVEISHIHGSFQAGEGLQLQTERYFDVSEPKGGVPLQQEVTVLPQQAGVLNLNATVVVDLDNGSIARTYSIPLIAGDAAS